jgi:hypothetical protein
LSMHLVFPAHRLTLLIPDFRCLIRLAVSILVFHLCAQFTLLVSQVP